MEMTYFNHFMVKYIVALAYYKETKLLIKSNFYNAVGAHNPNKKEGLGLGLAHKGLTLRGRHTFFLLFPSLVTILRALVCMIGLLEPTIAIQCITVYTITCTNTSFVVKLI